jgi:hypothetical protein
VLDKNTGQRTVCRLGIATVGGGPGMLTLVAVGPGSS